MAALAVHDREAGNAAFESLLPLIVQQAEDDRNYVKKAVNWALRQIGKRNRTLNRKAIVAAKRIARIDSPAARWIASDALRELQSDKVEQMLTKRRTRARGPVNS
jgi:3-methyladenine DNA glycosylase AlkD